MEPAAEAPKELSQPEPVPAKEEEAKKPAAEPKPEIKKDLKSAMDKKTEGNEEFKLSNFAEALDHYSEALDLFPDDGPKDDKAAILFNMGMSHAKLVSAIVIYRNRRKTTTRPLKTIRRQ